MEMTPKNLDILLIGRFGKRKTNSLVEVFANNMGVIEDPTEIASLVKEMYWAPWNKEYKALSAEYNLLDPYSIKTVSEQKDDRDITKSGTVNTASSGTNSSEVTNKDERAINDKLTESSTISDTSIKTEATNTKDTSAVT